ncbi:TIR domain-containing protein [Rhodococcus sp. MALMAid1271]|uniref:TIR domain-containing protein n=1 Tax=Rhodococcus sp. MALMAid1271 TaxID=3411744 RepID=UPI003B9E4BCB
MADDENASGKTKVFISWSGAQSQAIALVWRDLLNSTFESVEPFVSRADIDAGSRGFDDIKSKLDGSSFCIAIVSRATEMAPWINFEAGALSKQVFDAKVRVVPCLVDYDSESELQGPLKQFQAKMLHKEGIRETLQALAKVVGTEWDKKQRGFESMWTHFDSEFEKGKETQSKKLAPRGEKDMLKEVVTLTRDISEQVSSLQEKIETTQSAFHKIEPKYIVARVELRDYLTEKFGKIPAYPRLVVNMEVLYLLARPEVYKNDQEWLEEFAEKWQIRIFLITPSQN